MSGVQLISFALQEHRIEPSETATFALLARNTFEEVAVTNVRPTATFTPSGTITLVKVSGDTGATVHPPHADLKFSMTIQTANAVPGDYAIDIRFDYDVVVPAALPKFSQESRTITVVPD